MSEILLSVVCIQQQNRTTSRQQMLRPETNKVRYTSLPTVTIVLAAIKNKRSLSNKAVEQSLKFELLESNHYFLFPFIYTINKYLLPMDTAAAAADDDSTTGNNNNNVRAALQAAVFHIVLAQDRANGTRTTSGAVRALTELLFQYTQRCLAPDLYAFSSHAGRKSTISPEDVALVLRKLPEQLELFTNKCLNHQKNNSKSRGRSSSPIAPLNKRKDSFDSSSSSSSDDEDGNRSLLIATNGSGRKAAAGAKRKTTSSSPPPARRRAENLLKRFDLAPMGNLSSSSSSEDDEDNGYLKPINEKQAPPKRIISSSKPKGPLEDSSSSSSSSSDEENELVLAPKRQSPSTKHQVVPKKPFLGDSSDEDIPSSRRKKPKAIPRPHPAAASAPLPSKSQVASIMANLSSDSAMSGPEDEDEEQRFDDENEQNENSQDEESKKSYPFVLGSASSQEEENVSE